MIMANVTIETVSAQTLSVHIVFPLIRPTDRSNKRVLQARPDVATFDTCLALVKGIAEKKPESNITLDLSKCGSIDAYGITFLLKLRKLILKDNNRRVVYIKNPKPKILDVLKMENFFDKGIFRLLLGNVDITTRYGIAA